MNIEEKQTAEAQPARGADFRAGLSQESGAPTGNRPRLSIGMPVYNGENYIAAALDSLLEQTFRDFELIISDNASTDSTPQICAEYASRDPRVRYFRNERNIGLVRNFNRAFELSSGEYFKFAPHDDIYDRDFLARCIRILDEDPSVVLCNANVAIIDETGQVVRKLPPELNADRNEPQERFLALLNNSKCFDLFGVIRRNALAGMPQPLYQSYGNSDGVLLARLGLIGRFRYIEDHLYFNRDYKDRSGNKYKSYREYTYFLDPSTKGKIIYPRWRMLREFARSISLVPLDRRQRFRCAGHLARWTGWYWKSLAANIAIGAYETLLYPWKRLLRIREQGERP